MLLQTLKTAPTTSRPTPQGLVDLGPALAAAMPRVPASAHPPASPAEGESALSALIAGELPAGGVSALYVHIPFCFHKCHYCDFYSITRQTPQRMDHFVDAILSEADQWLSLRSVRPAGLTTIFFGGGTPSLLPLATMRRLLIGLKKRFDVSQLSEWTVEVNPATAAGDYCRMLREEGVDRLSFGAQSFDRAELALLERHHDPDDVAKSLDIARAAGFTRRNLDLIYAIAGQNLQAWSRSLETAIALRPEHISCYNLTYEPNTPMAVRKRLGHFTAVDEETELAMFAHTRRRLCAAGYAAYEISNYSLPGQACRHNLIYWTGGNYIGLGPAAASHISGHRWRNRPHLGEWENAITAGRLAATDVEHLSSRQRAGELAMLLLRLEQGLIYDVFAARTGHDAHQLFAGPIKQLTRAGLLDAGGPGLRLTDRGRNVADAVAAEFLLDV